MSSKNFLDALVDALPPGDFDKALKTAEDKGIRQFYLPTWGDNVWNRDMSLDFQRMYNEGDGNELLLSDILGTDDDVTYQRIEKEVDIKLLAIAMTMLSAREQEILRLRFGLMGNKERTQKEVADILGISQSYISRLEKRIIKRLKKEILKMN